MSTGIDAVKRTIEPLAYADYVKTVRGCEPELADAFAGFASVEHVLQWMERQGLSHTPVDIVGQDEFSYDFLVHFSAPERWLAFGVT